jgi:PmbA protein
MPRSYAQIKPTAVKGAAPARLFDYQQADFEQLTQDVMKQAMALGATAAVAEVSESSGLSVAVRKRQVETIEQTRDKGLGITVHVGQRRGHASTSDFSPQALQRTVQAAFDIASITGEDAFAGLPDEDRLARGGEALP